MRPFAVVLVLAAAASAAVSVGAEPVPPPEWARQRPDAGREPLDVTLRSQGRSALAKAPADWCPTGPELNAWLERRGVIDPPGRSRPKAHGDLPVVRLENGVVVMEDDGTLLRFDRRPDLEGVTLELTPSGDDYRVTRLPLAYEADVGIALFAGQRGWAEQPVGPLPFAFPFGGTGRDTVHVTSTMTLAFTDPAPPGPAQLRLPDVLGDRSPRIAPFQQGSSLLGWDAYYRQHADRVVVTWRAVDGGWLDLDVQVVLHADGRIRLTYRSLRGTSHGSVVVIDGDDAWWNDRDVGGAAPDPPGDVALPAPDGPAVDIVAVRAFQIGGSELLRVEVEMSAPLPAATDAALQFAFELADEADGPVFDTKWAEWEDGGWNWTNYPTEISGTTIAFTLNRTDLALEDDDIEIVAWAGAGWMWQEAVQAFLYWAEPPVPLMRDLSAADGSVWRGPLAESFTIPELQIGPVYDAFMGHFGSPRIDGLAVYQNFETDIVFYAGAWSTVGNAGADGIGAGSTSDPESPALLHMNALRYGWNSWDEGKVTVLNHEFGHHWLYFFSIMENGMPGKPLGDGHPAGWVHAPAAAPVYNPWDASCMGGSTWTDNADGTFRSAPGFASFGYSWHELYMMGLAAPSEVTDFFYLRDADPALPGAYWPPEDLTVTATRADVTLSQITDAMGPRTPAAGASRTEFIVPMVLVVRPGEVTQADVDEVAYTCAIWEPKFEQATLDRGDLTCNRVSLVNRPPVARIVEPATHVSIEAGTTVSFLGEGEDPDGTPVELLWTFDDVSGPATGPGPHDVTFPTPGLYAVQLTARDPEGVFASWSDVRVIEVGCWTPDEVQDLRVARDRRTGLMTFTWADPAEWPEEFVLLSTPDVRRPMTEEASAIGSIVTATPPERVVFYKVAGRNRPDCLGPY